MKVGKMSCKTLEDHEFGWKTIGGFPGHEHEHPAGPQVCFRCGKTLPEITRAFALECVGEDEKVDRNAEAVMVMFEFRKAGRNQLRKEQRKKIEEAMG